MTHHHSARPSRLATLFIGLLALLVTTVAAADVEQETLKRLDQLRAISPEASAKMTEGYNRQMDAMWAFFNANKPAVLPVLRRELTQELKKAQHNDMVLLDIGYYLRLQDAPADKALGREALFGLDPTAKVIQANQQQLFEFAHEVAPDRDPRTLAFLDRAFLRGKVSAFIPQHALSLDDTMVCVFLYGVYGDGAEAHLDSLLGDKAISNKIIEILIWIGSPNSVPAVSAAMAAKGDYDTFVRGTAFMMKIGGPAGRTAMLALNPNDFHTRAQEYYAQVRQEIESTNYDGLKRMFANFPGPAKVSDDELKKRLAAMYAHYGKDADTSPAAIIDSGLPSPYLIGELSRIRTRMFHRISDEALSDVEITNAILTALRYRGA